MRRSNLMWGAFLIVIGTLFLLNNLGVIQFNFWGVFWPVALIFLGLTLLVSSRERKSDAPKILTIPLKGVEEAHIRLDYGVGELIVNGRTPPDALIDGNFSGGVNFNTHEKNSLTTIELRPPKSSWLSLAHDHRWQVGLNRDIPLMLSIKTGASEARLNLADLNLSQFNLHTGASETHVTLPALAGYTTVDVQTGMAEVNIVVPDSVAARIRADAGLAEIKVDESRFPRNGKGYVSADYETAVHRADISVSVGLGSVKIW